MLTQELQQILIDKINLGLEHLVKLMREELRDQGHRVTGSTEESFRIETTITSLGTVTGKVISAAHTRYLDRGRRPGRRPPFAAIRRWAGNVFRGLSDKELDRVTFAVINAIAKEGSPTARSFVHSKNGRRTEFIKEALKGGEKEFARIIDLFSFALRLADVKLGRL